MSYSGWALSDTQRDLLLLCFPPSYPDVIAHHITKQFPFRPGDEVPTETFGDIVGIANDGKGVEALVVEIGGTVNRPDGSIYHITWSIDRAAKRKPFHSNDVVKTGWTPLEMAVPIILEPKIFKDKE